MEILVKSSWVGTDFASLALALAFDPLVLRFILFDGESNLAVLAMTRFSAPSLTFIRRPFVQVPPTIAKMESLTGFFQHLICLQKTLNAVMCGLHFRISFLATFGHNWLQDTLEARHWLLAFRTISFDLRALVPVNLSIAQHHVFTTTEWALHLLAQTDGSMVQQVFIFEGPRAIRARNHDMS